MPRSSRFLSHLVSFAALLPAATTQIAASDHSIDCASPGSKVDQAICADSELSALATQVAADYRQRLLLTPMDLRPVLNRIQIEWSTSLTHGCAALLESSMGQCIRNALRQRAALLEDDIAKLQAAKAPR
jgi:uncharacterized protein